MNKQLIRKEAYGSDEAWAKAFSERGAGSGPQPLSRIYDELTDKDAWRSGVEQAHKDLAQGGFMSIGGLNNVSAQKAHPIFNKIKSWLGRKSPREKIRITPEDVGMRSKIRVTPEDIALKSLEKHRATLIPEKQKEIDKLLSGPHRDRFIRLFIDR